MAVRRIAEYELLEPLTEADFGECFRARRLGDPRLVELHVFPEVYLTDDDWREKAVCWQGLCGFDHPHVQRLLDFGRSDGTLYMVYEPVAARPLRQLLRWQYQQGKRLRGPAAAALMLPVCEGLAALEQNLGLVHGGLGPESIWVRDSGLGMLVHVVEPPIRRSMEGMVGRPVVRPNWRYLSPEQVRGLSLAPPTDVYALGTLLYELLSGRRPFIGTTDLELLQQIISPTSAMPIAQRVPEIEPELAAVIDRALQKDCAHRYSSAGELARALAAVAGPAEPLAAGATAEAAAAPAANAQPTAVAGLRIEACAMKWEELTPRAPIAGHPARHCARCDQAVVQAASADALGLALQGRCLHIKEPEVPPRSLWRRLLRR